MADLFGAFIGEPPRSRTAYANYSGPLNFSARISGLEEVASNYFRTRSDQNLEGQLENLLVNARGFSMRRNEIVHSCISPIGPLTIDVKTGKILESPGVFFFLVPPLYHDKKWSLGGNEAPAFMYGSTEIEHYTQHFRRLSHLALILHMQVRGHKPPDLWPFDKPTNRN